MAAEAVVESVIILGITDVVVVAELIFVLVAVTVALIVCAALLVEVCEPAAPRVTLCDAELLADVEPEAVLLPDWRTARVDVVDPE